jgi:hypothetical protein
VSGTKLIASLKRGEIHISTFGIPPCDMLIIRDIDPVYAAQVAAVINAVGAALTELEDYVAQSGGVILP